MERKDLLLGSFLARALDLIVSACGFLSSSLSPEAATHYLHLPSIVSLDTFAHAHRAFNLTPSPGPKKLSNVFIIIRVVGFFFFGGLFFFFFFVLSSSSDHLSLPPPLSRHHHSLPLICPFKKNQPSPLLTLRTLTLHTGQYLRIKVPSYKEVEGSALGSASRGTGEAGRGAETREKWGEEGKATPEPSRRTCPPAPAAKVERAPALKKGAKCK